MGKDLKGKELGKGITQRKDGLYMGRAMIDGKSVGPFYGRDLEEVKKKLQSEKTNAQLNNLYQIIESERSIPSLEEWAMTWFKLYKQPTLKRKNSNSYMRSVKNYILCNIGSKPIDLVRQLDIQLCVAEATKRGIQGKSLREAVGTLQQCFDSAVANGYIRVNPAIGVLVANSSPVKRRVLSQEEEKRLRTYLVESKNWFCIHGKFISKNMTIIGRAWVAASLNNRDITPVKIFYMTGQYLEVKAGYSWKVSTIQSFNQLLWEKYQIIPVKVFSRDYERISTILKNTYDRMKTEKDLCEKEFVRYLLEDGADSKALFWSEIPGFQLPGENK